MDKEAIRRYHKAIERMRDGSLVKRVAECYFEHRLLGIKTSEIAIELGIERSQATSSRWALMSVYGFELVTCYGKAFRLNDVTLRRSKAYLESTKELNKRRFEQRRLNGSRERGANISGPTPKEIEDAKKNRLIRGI